MMKRMILLAGVLMMGFLSCQALKVNPVLDVQIVKGRVSLVESESGNVAASGLTAGFADANDRAVFLNPVMCKLQSRRFSDDMGTGNEFVMESRSDTLTQRWIIRTFERQPVFASRFEVINHRNSSERINQLIPLKTAEEGVCLLPHQNDLRFLDIEPLTWWPKESKQLVRPDTARFVTGIGNVNNQGVVLGALSFDRFGGNYQITPVDEGIQFTTWHDVDDHLLVQPGESLASEWIYVHCTDNLFAGLEHWAGLAGELNGAVFSDPPATGFYTWYYYREHVSEKIMMENARFLAENQDRFPVNYVRIDWGWQRQFSTGDTTVNGKFPHGLRWLAGQIRDLGFTPSVWVNPFMYTDPSAEAVTAHPDIFLRDEKGDLVSREPIRNIMGRAFGNGEHMILDGVTNILDVSNPDARQFLHDRYQWVRSMGYDMAMMDFIQEGRNNPDNGDQLKYSNVSTYEGIKQALQSAQKGLGAGGDILGCGTLYEPSIGISNLTRISTDAPAIWSCVKTACNDLILQYFMNGRLWTNYADGLFVRDKISPYWRKDWWDENGTLVPMRLSDDEAQFYTAVTGLSQAAVMYTEDIQRLKPDRQWLLSMVLPIYDKGVFHPVDLFQEEKAKTLQLVCEENGRQWIVAAGLNWEESPDETGLQLNRLSLIPDQIYHAWDVFQQKYLGMVDGQSTLGPVNPRGVRLVNLTPDLSGPQVIGTDLHIGQGGLEIASESWDENTGELKVVLKDLYGRKGHVMVYVPEGYNVNPESPGHLNGRVLKVPVMLDHERQITLYF